MSDISQIQVNGTTYDLCDATSRTQIANLQDSVSRKVDTYNCEEAYIQYNNSSYPFDIWEFDENGKAHILRIVPGGLQYVTAEDGVYTTVWTK